MGECYITFLHLWVPKYIMIKHVKEMTCEIFKHQRISFDFENRKIKVCLAHYNKN